MRKKLVGLSLIVGFAAAAAVIWTAPSLTRQAQATAETMPSISPDELQQRIDIKGLPVPETADLI
jgi:hypothetical protein